MTTDPAPLLRSQLLQALAGQAEPLELAILGGLLRRLSPGDPLLAQLADLGPSPARVSALRAHLSQALQALEEIDEDDDPALSWDALAALDELCAAAAFLGRADLVAEAVQDAAALVRAFPEAWAPHADAASGWLEDAPPGDPARALWTAVEAASRGLAPDAEGQAPADLRMQAGVDVVVPLFGRRSAELRAAAAAPLAEEGPWTRLAHGEGWELALTTDPSDQPILLLAGEVLPARITVAHEGQAIALQPGPEGQWCPASPGAWQVTLGDRHLTFRVEA